MNQKITHEELLDGLSLTIKNMFEILNNEAVNFFIKSYDLIPVGAGLKFTGSLPPQYGESTRVWFSGGPAALVSRIKVDSSGQLVDGVEFRVLEEE